MFELINYDKRQKRCHQCFAYVRASLRKCQFCGYVFKSRSRHLFDTIKQVLKIEQAYSVNQIKRYSREQIFFTAREVDDLFEARNYKILMFLVLSDMNFLDEASLIELGKTVMSMDKPNFN